jgi:hypothetical protein
MSDDAARRAFEALSKHPRLADLAAVAAVAVVGGAVGDKARELGLTPADTATDFGNALEVLERAPKSDDERALATALCAYAVVGEPGLAARLLPGAQPPAPAPAPALAPAPAPTPAPAASAAVAPVVGELAPAPRGPVATGLLAFTGILFVTHAARLVGRWALAYRRPAEITLSEDGGVRVQWKTQLLGRTLRDRAVVVPRTALARATRDVRYPSIALYAGLLALAVGSWVGVAAFVDGVRAASPSLLAWGLAIVALGLGIDFALSSLAPGARGRCRLLVVPRDGSHLCVGDVDTARADAVLARLSKP